MKGALAIFWFVSCLTTAAGAANPFPVIRSFGLLGTWDQNCTGGITDSMLLIRFTMTSVDDVRLIVSHPDEILYESKIDSARLITPDEIRMMVEGGFDAPQRQLTFKLDAGELKIVSTSTTYEASTEARRSDDVTHDSQSPPLHRCVSE